jgi:hypothetical protein
MPYIVYIKKKERLVLALRIKKLNKEAETYSYYLCLSRYYFLDLSKSS